jgi:hypothetical protein
MDHRSYHRDISIAVSPSPRFPLKVDFSIKLLWEGYLERDHFYFAPTFLFNGVDFIFEKCYNYIMFCDVIDGGAGVVMDEF